MQSTLVVERIDPLDPAQRARTAAYLDVFTEASRADLGDRYDRLTLAELQGDARPARQHRSEHLVAVLAGSAEAPDGERVVGVGELRFPLLDNLNQAFAHVAVHPDHRRRGIGSALLAHLEERTRAAGRSLLTIESLRLLDRADEVSAFAHRHGFSAALADHRSDLDLPAAGSPEAVEALLAPLDAEVTAADPASDYDLVTYQDTIPEQWQAGRAALEARMSTDAPLGELELEPEHWDAERIQESLRNLRSQGRHIVETIAVHRSSGAVAGFTMLVHNPEHDGIAHQWNTLVLPEHRGRRLGMWLKTTNLRALLERFPEIRQVRTFNAQVNEPMLRVNRAMGFRPVAELIEWQKPL